MINKGVGIMLYERASNILKIILSNRLITIKQLEEQTNCTRRQINYDLEKINEWLVKQNLNPIKNKRGYGLLIDEKTKERILAILPNLQTKEYVFSNDIRHFLILVYLFINTNYVSVIHLSDLLNVSRNTILNSIKSASQYAKHFNVNLTYNRQNGYHLHGKEMDIRNLIFKCISELLLKTNGMNILEDLYNEKKGRGHFKKTYKSIHTFLRNIEEKLQVVFVEERMKELSVFLTFLIIRMDGRHSIFFPLELQKTLKDTSYYKVIFKEISKLNWDLQVNVPEKEMIYLTILLLGLNLRYDNQLYHNQINEKELYELVDEILLDFETLACVNFTNREQAKKSLFLHLKPAYYRMIYNIPISNPYLEKIKEEYFDLFILVKRSLKKLEELAKTPISDDEVGFITLHFGAFLKERGLPYRRKRGIIVCPNGLATSNMLKKQIEKLVPEIEIVNVISIREYDYSKEDEFDVIFSTVMLQTNKPLIIVPPLLTALDKAKIIQEIDFILNGTKSLYPNANKLLQVIKLFATVHDEDGLYKAITEVLTGRLVEKIGGYKPVLKELLTREMIQLADSIDSWENAIQLAAKPLLEIQAIEETYIEAMIENVKKLGPYIVLTPYVAIPHARPEHGVKKIGMSLLKLKNPVSFSNNNSSKDVHLIFVLSAVDNETHLKALSQLTELIDDEENINKLIAANSVEEIIPLIEKISN